MGFARSLFFLNRIAQADPTKNTADIANGQVEETYYDMVNKGLLNTVSGSESGARLRPGIYYTTPGGTNSAAVNLNMLYLIPFFVPRPASFDKIGIQVNGGVASSTIRLGIYADIKDAYGGYPDALILDAGTVDSSTSGFKELPINVTLQPGLYWLAGVAQGGAPSTSILSTGVQTVGYQASGGIAGRVGIALGGITGALPANYGVAAGGYSSQGSVMLVQIRCSA